MNTNMEIEELDLKNPNKYLELKNFLLEFDLQLDNVDYTIVFRKDNKIIATISKYENLIKCSAVALAYSGQNFLNQLVTKMLYKIETEGYSQSFLITKPVNKIKFIEIGLYVVYQNEKVVFFTSNLHSLEKYQDYLAKIANNHHNQKACAIVVNANPFSKGHEFLIKTAAKENKLVYLIPVQEDVSFFSYQERVQMIANVIGKYDNVFLLEGSQYLIAKAIFPSYFLNEEDEIVMAQATLDVGLFWEIYCKRLNIDCRYVGEEPLSRTTAIYNRVLEEFLTAKKIKLKIIKRAEVDGKVISASLIRKAILTKDDELIKKLSHPENHQFLTSKEVYERALKQKNKIYKDN